MNHKLSDAEYKFCSYQIGQLGGFYTQLIRAMLFADDNNLKKLRLAFPEITEVVYRFGHEDGYWKELMEKWNAAYPSHQII